MYDDEKNKNVFDPIHYFTDDPKVENGKKYLDSDSTISASTDFMLDEDILEGANLTGLL